MSAAAAPAPPLIPVGPRLTTTTSLKQKQTQSITNPHSPYRPLIPNPGLSLSLSLGLGFKIAIAALAAAASGGAGSGVVD